MWRHLTICFFFFNDTATTEIYTLSLHDALPISHPRSAAPRRCLRGRRRGKRLLGDRKSTRLNSSHTVISYAVFCLKKKKKECRARRCHCAACWKHHKASRAAAGPATRTSDTDSVQRPNKLTSMLDVLFCFNDTPPAEIYPLSLHDAFPI